MILELKRETEKWWNSHSQDYKDEYKYINVYLRYGVFKLKFFQGYTKQKLKNIYIDGKEFGGAPIIKHYSKKDLLKLFKELTLINCNAYEQNNSLTFWIPKNYKYKVEKRIPDKIYTFLFKYFGFLLFSRFVK